MAARAWTSGSGIYDLFDVAALELYLSENLEGFAGPIEVKAFSEGQSNPTFLLTTLAKKYVLRKKPPGVLLKSAHAVDREYRVQRALWGSDVPVAKVLHLCEDESVIGTIFYVMDFSEGRIFWDPALLEMTQGERAEIYDEMNRVLAAIHNVDLEKTELTTFGRSSNYFARQLKRWSSQFKDSETEPMPEMDDLIDWLTENLPDDDGQVALVHGDYRIDNLMFAKDSLKIVAVFDWELSTLGHPLADLAYQIMQRSMGRDWHLQGLAGLDWQSLGIPSEKAYVETYCKRRNLDELNNWAYAKIFAFFRFAAICQGVKKRALDGNAASPDALRVGEMAKPLAKIGAGLIR